MKATIARGAGVPVLTNRTELGELAERNHILGRGGAGFPFARKIRALPDRGTVVVVNCCEGDPTSRKDATYVYNSPELVQSGVELVANALRARRTILAVHEGTEAENVLRSTAPVEVEILAVPPLYVASEATALINYLNVGTPRPAGSITLPTTAGAGGMPTLISNVETFVHVAWAARGELAPPARRAMLSTVTTSSGQQVITHRADTAVDTVLQAAAADHDGEWILVGGITGRWVHRDEVGPVLAGALAGLPSYVILDRNTCPIGQTARMLADIVRVSAGQCGPCIFGLPAIRKDMRDLVRGDLRAYKRLRRRLPVISGRGACAHPTGAVGLAASALEIVDHGHRCTARCDTAGVASRLARRLR